VIVQFGILANQNTSLNAHAEGEAAGNELRSPVNSATTNTSLVFRQFDNSSKLESPPHHHTPEDAATAQLPNSPEGKPFGFTATTCRPPAL